MHPMLTIAVRAARSAGTIITRNMDRLDRLNVVSKKNNDFVTEVDHKAEQVIIEEIRNAYPDHSFLAEESGITDSESDHQWIIDPLDGTTNFLHGFPQYAVSIALRVKNRLEVAVVYDPVSQEMFTAARGEGAQLNDKKIRVSGHKGLEGALLATGFPYTDQSYLDTYIETLRAIMPTAAGIRRPGSAALDLAWMAAGRVDGFWEFNLNTWDIAAGVLIAREAGAIISDLTGGEDYLNSGDIIAASPKVFPAMLKAIHPIVSKSDYLEK